MFSKGSKSTGSAGAMEASRAASKPSMPSIISTDLKVTGNLVSAGDLQIEGTVEGDVESRTVTIGEGAQIYGAINAETARICGAVTGQIKADSVTLAKTAKVVGDILHRTLEIEQGAFVDGHCRRTEASPSSAEGRVSLVREKGAAPTTEGKTATAAATGGLSSPSISGAATG